MRPGDAVLVKGSLGSRMKRVVASASTRLGTEERLMLYNLLAPASPTSCILFNLFRYLTFRAGAACMTALVVSFLLGPCGDPLAASRCSSNGQPIRLDGPERHLIEKKGTPTMGGVLILAA